MSKLATITLHKIAILAEIDAQTFKRVDGVLSAESDQVKNALSSDSEENLDQNILHRHMENRDSIIRSRLAFCLEKSEEALSVDNLLEKDSPAFTYTISVPDTCDKQRLKSLAQKMHNYIVQGAICDWYATQNMKGNVDATDLERMEDEIAAMLRSSFVKRPIQPFGPRN